MSGYLMNPVSWLTNFILNVHYLTNGRYLTFLVHYIKAWRRSRSVSSRFSRAFGDLKDPFENGLLPRQIDQYYERPSKEKGENIYLYGVNSKGQYILLNLSWSPNPGDDSGVIRCHLKVKGGDGNVYQYTKSEKIFNIESFVEYKVGDLKVEIQFPLKRVKVKFNGVCRVDKQSRHEFHFVKIVALLLPPQEAFDHCTTFDPSFIASQICNNSKSKSSDSFPWQDMYDLGLHVKLSLTVEHGAEQDFNLWGLRSKLYTENQGGQTPRLIRFSGYALKKGYNFSIALIEKEGHFCVTGFAGWGLGLVYPIRKASLCKTLLDMDQFQFSLEIEQRAFQILAEKSEEDPSFYRIFIDSCEGVAHKCELPFESYHEMFNQTIDDYETIARIPVKSSQLVVSIGDVQALNSDLTGGKGSSLAKLTKLIQHTANSFKFNVTQGIIVTTNSYKLMSDKYQLKSLLQGLRDQIRNGREEDLQGECSRIVESIEKKELPSEVMKAIGEKMSSELGSNWTEKRYAVRSSAVGEDSEELSCAGQMETFLGVSGTEEIFEAVMKCWASQFRLLAIQYKRSNGQDLDLDMAVVIQEMIDCEKAGVLFTCDPVNGDSRSMMITANYGLGESVVSSTSEPDMVKVNVKLTEYGPEIDSIGEITIGSKEKIIHVSEEGNGIVVLNNSNNDSCCLTDREISLLSEICLKVSKYFPTACDIEWGMKSDQIYLFQCRPVTSLNSHEEWELMHELDSPHVGENEFHTRANLGEVYPGSTSHICCDYQLPMSSLGYLKTFIKGFKSFRFVPYVVRGFAFSRAHNFFSLKDGILFSYDTPPEQESIMTTAMEFAMLGNKIDKIEMKRDSYERLSLAARQSGFQKMRMVFEYLFLSPSRLNQVQMNKFTVKYEVKSSHEVYQAIIRNPDYLWDAFTAHLGVTVGSSVMNLLMISMLSIAGKENPNLLSDFSILLSSCQQIVSAEVPKALRKMASKVKDRQEFLNLSQSEALDYLTNGSSEVSQAYREFIEKFGHRGLKEFDWSGKIWRKDPTFILSSLKGLMKGNSMAEVAVKPELSDDEIVSKLQTRLSRTSKFILKRFLLNWTRKYVSLRERGKNMLVWKIDQMRRTFDEMAEILVYHENRLPDKNLAYYLTPPELFDLTLRSNPKLVSLAKRRRKVLDKMDSYEFPIILQGPEMKPSNLSDDDDTLESYGNGREIHGVPVSQGKIKARIFVAKRVEDAAGIEPGDILVTYSTDIGWSPYFPLIGGLLTEIGGLISHGAVIAREFGLPCIVAIPKATSIFKTGEMVLLDANKGIIIKLDEQAKPSDS